MTAPKRLPAGRTAYRRTPVFNQDTTPAGLRSEHRTKAGVWAVITVLEGQLRFRTLEPISQTLLSPAASGIVAPEQPHRVDPHGNVRFFVEFYRGSRQP